MQSLRFSFNWTFLVALLGIVVVSADKKTTIKTLDNLKIQPENVSEPIVGLIDGNGWFNINQLVYSVDHAFPDKSIFIDVVMSTLPNTYNMKKAESKEEQAKNEYWQMLGIGNGGSDYHYYKCCTQRAIDAGACNEDRKGRLIISNELDMRLTHTIELPPGVFSTEEDEAIAGGKKRREGFHSTHAVFQYTTHAVMVIGNCNTSNDDDGDSSSSPPPRLMVNGDIEIISRISFLDSSLIFPFVMMILHCVVLLWYRRCYYTKDPNTRIQIEFWIYSILILTTLSSILDVLYLSMELLFIQHEHILLRIVTDFTNKISHIASRCLYVVLAHGYGVIHTKLHTLIKVGLLILSIMILSIRERAELMGDIAFLRRENQMMSEYNMKKYALQRTSFYFNAGFAIWIPLALIYTIYQLKKKGTTEIHKLHRYGYLLGIYLFAGFSLFVMVLIQSHGKRWFWTHAMFMFSRGIYLHINHVIYWLVLTMIAICWKPTPEAPMYGYVRLNDESDNNAAISTLKDLELMESTNNNNDSFDDEETEML